MSSGSRLRALCVSLILFSWLAEPAAAVTARTRDWVSMVVTKIAKAAGDPAVEGGTVTIRVRIESTGALADVGIDTSSGSAAIDARALLAVKSAAPFKPPPRQLLTLEGFTELSFPLQLSSEPSR